MRGDSTTADCELSAEEIDRIRTRVRLMTEISARAARFRRGPLHAAERLSPEEAAVVADLERHGLDVIKLRDLLRGAHVLVDEPYLYERWLFPHVSPPAALNPTPRDRKGSTRTTACVAH